MLLKIIIMKKYVKFDLGFFAAHFNLDEERLDWCILEDRANLFQNFMLGIKIQNSGLVISVEQKALAKLGRKLKTYDAKFTAKGTKYQLTSLKPICEGKCVRLNFTEQNLRDLYLDQWYQNAIEPKR